MTLNIQHFYPSVRYDGPGRRYTLIKRGHVPDGF